MFNVERAAGPAPTPGSSLRKGLVAVACLLVGAVGMMSAASAQTTLPIRHTLDSQYPATMVQAQAGCTHTFVPTGGWRGTGAIKFTPPTTAEGTCGLWAFDFANLLQAVPEQVNVRFLVYHGSTWLNYGAANASPYNKLVILNRNGNRGRPMIITQPYGSGDTRYETWSACDGTVCEYDGENAYSRGTDRLRIGNQPWGREQEWISVELEANSRTGMIKLYVDTQDGEMSGLYIERYMDDTGPGGTWSFGCVGCYMSRAAQTHPDNYFIIDDVVVNSSRIGPPAGFTSSVQPRPPSNVTVQ